MARPEFDTSEYRRSHGKAPRGFGVWAFSPDTTGEWDFSPSLNYAQAKEWARDRHPDATRFTVGP